MYGWIYVGNIFKLTKNLYIKQQQRFFRFERKLNYIFFIFSTSIYLDIYSNESSCVLLHYFYQIWLAEIMRIFTINDYLLFTLLFLLLFYFVIIMLFYNKLSHHIKISKKWLNKNWSCKKSCHQPHVDSQIYCDAYKKVCILEIFEIRFFSLIW